MWFVFSVVLRKPPYAPLRMYIDKKWHKFIPSWILDACLLDNFEDHRSLEKLGHTFPNVLIHEYVNSAYEINMNEEGQEARRSMMPHIFNLLVDQCQFEDNFKV